MSFFSFVSGPLALWPSKITDVQTSLIAAMHSIHGGPACYQKGVTESEAATEQSYHLNENIWKGMVYCTRFAVV